MLVLVSLKNNAQQLVSATYLKSYPASYFAQQFGLFAGYDVDLYRIIYTSKEVNGDATNVSGLVCLPKVKTSGYPMLVYQHGTAGSRAEVPGYESFESVLPSIFSSIGFISIAPITLALALTRVYIRMCTPLLNPGLESTCWLQYNSFGRRGLQYYQRSVPLWL